MEEVLRQLLDEVQQLRNQVSQLSGSMAGNFETLEKRLIDKIRSMNNEEVDEIKGKS
jgi:hypothetical protein